MLFYKLNIRLQIQAVILLYNLLLATGQDEVFIDTNYGLVKGMTSTYTIYNGTDKYLTKFYGIPYAKPPINDLRFMRPQLPEPWNNVLDATVAGHSCFQQGVSSDEPIMVKGEDSMITTQSEDCLQLNIYYPGRAEDMNSTDTKAVMVFLHKGFYSTGTSYEHNGGILATTKDVIVITVNYRLGLFGFASSPDGLLPGNQGLLDQHMALIWIKDNIVHFGGDPDLVTLFGSSSGADSVLLHLASPLSQGLFSKAIIQSDDGIYERITQENQYEQLQNVANVEWNCDISGGSDNSSAQLLDCLKNLTAEQLNNINNASLYTAYNLAPVVFDGSFVMDEPVALFEQGSYNSTVDIMIGFNADDGDFVVRDLNMPPFPQFLSFGIEYSQAIELMRSIFPLVFGHNYGDEANDELLFNITIDFYFSDLTQPLDVARAYLNFYTHYIIGSHSVNLANIFSNHGTNVYLYYFNYRAESTDFVFDQVNDGELQLSAVHGEELFYVFGDAATGTESDQSIALAVMNAWSSFAKIGTPLFSENMHTTPVAWSAYSEESKSFIDISPNVFNSEAQQIPEEFIKFTQLFIETLPEINTANNLKFTVAQTSFGNVIGFTSDHTDVTLSVTKFLGIPFAKPPIGNLRFQKPEDPDTWEQARLASQYGHSCIGIRGRPDLQFSNSVQTDYTFTMDEDCLFLNIFYPGSFQPKSHEAKPVIVFIHGGSFITGSGNLYDGSILAKTQDVIVVTMNYRLYLLGFSSTPDGVIPANLGLFDQHKALAWVQNSIHHFGGDPHSVTLVGHSAGAGCVVSHIASPLSNGLFRRAIIQSTFDFNYDNPINLLEVLSGSDSCNNMNCLSDMSGFEINNLMITVPSPSYMVVDGDFLPSKPKDMFREGRFNKSIDIMIGYTRDDGDVVLNAVPFLEFSNLVTEGIQDTNTVLQIYRQVWELMFETSYDQDPIANSNILLSIINHFYFKDVSGRYEVARKFLDSFTDFGFSSVSLHTADLISNQGANVYLYVFDYRSSNPLFQITDDLQPNMPVYALHGEELFYVFGFATLQPSSTEEFIALSIMNAWSEFSKTGQPIYYKSDNYPAFWQPYTSRNKTHFHITSTLTGESGAMQVPGEVLQMAHLWHSTIPNFQELPKFQLISDDVSDDDDDAIDDDSEDSDNSDPVFGLSRRMSQILLIMAACGFLFFMFLSAVLICCMFRKSKKSY